MWTRAGALEFTPDKWIDEVNPTMYEKIKASPRISTQRDFNRNMFHLADQRKPLRHRPMDKTNIMAAPRPSPRAKKWINTDELWKYQRAFRPEDEATFNRIMFANDMRERAGA